MPVWFVDYIVVYIRTTLCWDYWGFLRIFWSWERNYPEWLSLTGWKINQNHQLIIGVNWPESRLLLYLQLLSSSRKENWHLGQKMLASLLLESEAYLNSHAVFQVLPWYFMWQKVWGVVSKPVTPESRQFWPWEHPGHVICQAAGVWTPTQIWDVSICWYGCVCVCVCVCVCYTIQPVSVCPCICVYNFVQ